MNYISVSEAAKKWNISERSVRNYCAEGRVSGAVLVGKIWMIPEGAEKPIRKTRNQSKVSLKMIFPKRGPTIIIPALAAMLMVDTVP